jgi:anaerobic selenocysteine-containing dehydrogenase
MEKRPTKDGKAEWEFSPLLAVNDKGEPVPFDPNDDKKPVQGELLFSGELNGIAVKTVLQIYWEAASSKTFADWCAVGGVKEADFAAVAQEFTSHGKKAVADLHRGVSQHTNGFYKVVSWMLVNVLLGNHDWQGGLAKATTFNHDGAREGKPFNLTKHPAKMRGWGLSIIRHQSSYEKSPLFNG